MTTTAWQSGASLDAGRFATTREQHADRIETALQTGVHRAAGFYRAGRWARGEWELVLTARMVARLTGDRKTIELLEDLVLVETDPPKLGASR